MLNSEQLSSIIELTFAAGDRVLEFFAQQNFAVDIKPDQSPVTTADLAAHEIVSDGLSKLTPDIKQISEECPDKQKVIDDQGYYWLIDPLDGTRGFINGSENFTINIALMQAHKPIFGIILHPPSGDCYYSWKGDNYLIKQRQPAVKLQFQQHNTEQKRVVMGDRGTIASVEAIAPDSILRASSSVKFLYMLRGQADIYPALQQTMEWDVAAGHVMLQNIGGEIYHLDGTVKTYHHADFLNLPQIAVVNRNIWPEIANKFNDSN